MKKNIQEMILLYNGNKNFIRSDEDKSYYCR